MCGIAGIVGRLDPELRAALGRMNDAQSHRGPDAQGTWESPADSEGWGVMLAHRRLAILDLSAAGAQPMVDPVHGHVVVLNGEIYNYVDLRRDLMQRGETVASSGDTAVLLRSLSVDGRTALGRLRGMFALAFWNRHSRELTLARDPLGIKPLYMMRNPDPGGAWSVAFASELRALLASGLLRNARLDPQAVACMVWSGFTVGPGTAVLGVESLWPGEACVLDGRGRETARHRFWQAPSSVAQDPIDEEELGACLEECVRLHLASDVPLGIFLSGGIDSSAVAHLAQRSSGMPVHTFTLAFEEQERNEGPLARRIAQAIGTRHTEVVLSERHFIDRLDDALDSLDQPSFDGLNSYFMSHAVRGAGFKVALVGSGGDELFGGYTSFRDLPRMWRWSRRVRPIPRALQRGVASMVSAALSRSQRGYPAQTRWAKLPDMVSHGEDLLALYQLAYALFLPRTQRELLREGLLARHGIGLPPAMIERLRGETLGLPPMQAVSMLEQRLFLGERLLRDTDATSMSASIEIRLPLVDQVLLHQVARLPSSVRYEPVRAKAVLRRIGLRGLDPSLFDRPKSGFELPFDRWLRQALGSRIDATLRNAHQVEAVGLNPQAVVRLWEAFQAGSPGLYWSRVWALYVLIHWSHRHRVLL